MSDVEDHREGTYLDAVEALGDLAGRKVLVQIRTATGGDHLTIRGKLGQPSVMLDQAVSVSIGDDAYLVLHADENAQWHVPADGRFFPEVLIEYESGANLRCCVEGDDA